MVHWSLLIKKTIIVFLLSFSSQALDLVGKGLLTFTFLNFEVYELELYAKGKVSSFKELQVQDEYKLVFKFKRDVDKKYLKKAWKDASKEIGQKGLERLFDKVSSVQPSMAEGQRITVMKVKDSVTFNFPNTKIEITNSDFAKTLAWVWLGDNEVGEKLAYQIFR